MKALNELVEVFLKADDKEKMKNLLEGILTEKEIDELAQRIEIVRLLKKGVGQHQIAEKLKVGVATVSRGAKFIKMGKFKYV